MSDSLERHGTRYLAGLLLVLTTGLNMAIPVLCVGSALGGDWLPAALLMPLWPLLVICWLALLPALAKAVRTGEL